MMADIEKFVIVHQQVLIPIITTVMYWVISAAVSNLPVPTDQSSTKYKFIYGFCHSICANLDKLKLLKAIIK
jgi:hypothetical protein